jgi:hypothetical protein
MHQKDLNEIHGHDILKIWNVIDHDQQINMKVAGIHDPISQMKTHLILGPAIQGQGIQRTPINNEDHEDVTPQMVFQLYLKNICII